MPAPRRRRRTWCPSPGSPGSASRAWAGSSTSTSTASPKASTGTAGRCLSYGEGVTYWALADMVRMRCRIAEEEEPSSALDKLRATLEEQILDADERSFVEPRLAHLLGLGEHQARDQQDLFAAWRLFFERLAEAYPTVLAVRGHAVGGREPARLRRVPARLVAQLTDLRDHARPAGAARAPADLGCGPAQLHVPVPGAARAVGDGGAPDRPRARASDRRPRPDPRACRGHPAVRGRDRAHAARPRPARRGRLRRTG